MSEIDHLSQLIANEKARGDAIYGLLCKTDGVFGVASVNHTLRQHLPAGENAQRDIIARAVDEAIEYVDEKVDMGDGMEDAEPIHKEALRFLLIAFAKHEARMIGLRARLLDGLARYDAPRVAIIGTGKAIGPHGVLAHLRAEPPTTPAAMPTSTARPSDLATAPVA